jgi:anti-sigma B factor antagonist
MASPFGTSQAAAAQPITIAMSSIAPDVVLCVLTGEIDLATGPGLQEKLAELLHHAPAHLVIDLTAITFLGSTGLKILVETHVQHQAAGCHVAIVIGCNRAVTRPLQITGLDQELDLHTERATAVEACRARHKPRGDRNRDTVTRLSST